MRAVPSKYHQLLKFPAPEGIKQIRGDQLAAREMNAVSTSSTEILSVTEERDATKSTAEELEKVALFKEVLERKFHLGTRLNPELRYPSTSGRTQVNPGTELPSDKAKKKRPIAEVRNKFVMEEVTRLLDIGSIRKVKYPEWLSNVVVVPNKNNKFRMCVDYKDLNKACPKNSFPLSNIVK
ncbi:PREDICTED: uncharacterized protein LOC109236079 [Nicotiana attenuata]|uniref:uncharacterized protein LOC109236078 n=1 Tax=Nicotiana attenuata TaxID=49451 RepID=UPI0009050C8D|nr:PREDICTED: uncharacterized protein LOC109236078 [Nicotiana attenuata]XP_019257849.1 PREDICTED: uncharacterized protein LOC109236079 [Nicotiana attenuata]